MPNLCLRLLPICCSALLSVTATGAQPISIIAVGDVMLAGSGTGTYHSRSYDHPFKATSQILRSADITIGNLEAPITDRGLEFKDKQFRFRIDPRGAQAMKNAGFDVVTLANNHMLDYGELGLQDTMQYLKAAGIVFTGAGPSLIAARKPAIKMVGDRKVAVLSYSMTFPLEFYATTKRAGTAPGEPRIVAEDIIKARERADLVIVAFHWGAEKAVSPKPYQIASAHAAIDAGADLVIGHHPHVLQGIEVYKGKTIFYSLGNFAFGCISPSCDRSVIARINIDAEQQQVSLIPIDVLNPDTGYQPTILQGQKAWETMERLDALCLPLGTRINMKGSDYTVETTLAAER